LATTKAPGLDREARAVGRGAPREGAARVPRRR